MQKYFYWIQKHSSIVKKNDIIADEACLGLNSRLAPVCSGPAVAIESHPFMPGLCWWLHPQKLVRSGGQQG